MENCQAHISFSNTNSERTVSNITEYYINMSNYYSKNSYNADSDVLIEIYNRIEALNSLS